MRIGILAILLLSGCAGSAAFVKQLPVIGPGGEKTYLLTSEIHHLPGGKEYTLNGLNERANTICPSGYTLIHEEFAKRPNAIGMYIGMGEATWQIRCKNAEQPKS